MNMQWCCSDFESQLLKNQKQGVGLESSITGRGADAFF
jgi:hypothetical protein